MRSININPKSSYFTEESEREIVDLEKRLEGESIYEQLEEQEEYNPVNIIVFTFEDGTIPKSDGSLGTPAMFEKVFAGNDRVFTTKNETGYHVFIATEREDLYKFGYVIMNSREFTFENPDGLFDIWVSLLKELQS